MEPADAVECISCPSPIARQAAKNKCLSAAGAALPFAALWIVQVRQNRIPITTVAAEIGSAGRRPKTQGRLEPIHREMKNGLLRQRCRV